jgi:hypothetical protein
MIATNTNLGIVVIFPIYVVEYIVAHFEEDTQGRRSVATPAVRRMAKGGPTRRLIRSVRSAMPTFSSEAGGEALPALSRQIRGAESAKANNAGEWIRTMAAAIRRPRGCTVDDQVDPPARSRAAPPMTVFPGGLVHGLWIRKSKLA